MKEVKLRPNIDDHDYEVKMRSMVRFLEEGDKVKVTLRFRGREMAHQGLGQQLLDKVATELEALGKVEVHAPAGRPPDGDDCRAPLSRIPRPLPRRAFRRADV